MEWLSHQSKKDKKCDICDTPYRFRVIYDANMPSQMPLGEVVHRIVALVGKTCFRTLSFIFFALCVAQIPLFWKFMGRLFTYAVDGKMPVPKFTARHVLLYGAYTTHARSGADLSTENATLYDKVETFFYDTYLPGLFQVLVFVLVLFVVFIEHEWVVREEGYTKLLLRQIGREPRTKLADLLGLMRENHLPRQAGAGDDTNTNVEVPQAANNNAAAAAAAANPAPNPRPDESSLNRAIEDLRQFQANHRANDSPLHRALERNEYGDLINAAFYDRGNIETMNRDPYETENTLNLTQEAPEQLQTIALNNLPEDDEADQDYVHEEGSESESEIDSDTDGEELNLHDEPGRRPHQQDHRHNNDVHPIEDVPQPRNFRLPDAINPDVLEDETAEELERRQNLVEDEMMAAEAANENIFELLGFRFNLITPIQLMILADFIIVLFLFSAYLVPHTIGNMFFYIYVFAAKSFRAIFTSLVPLIPLLEYMRDKFEALGSALGAKFPFLALVGNLANAVIFKPLFDAVLNATSTSRTSPPSLTERCVYLGIGWVFICNAVNGYMKNLVSREKPVVGTSRKIYKVLFRIVATAKVFAIFGIEIVLFPIYCGFLLDICLAPLFIDQFIVNNGAQKDYYLLLTTSKELGFNNYFRVLLYWLAGTCYMFFIALFVSMIRSKILRPGVLYFIKSPEDPNARLIHDAVVKPMKLQILRILLSARVYLTLILGGIGAVTWSLRFLVNSPTAAEQGALFPIQFPGVIGVLALKAILYSIIHDREVIVGPCQRFWKRSFAVLSHKLRLSHFILDTPVPQERGYVVYRNLFYRILELGVPDYTKPMSYSEAQATFKADPTVIACFVPDGTYIRAPSSDDNSRSFLKLMFLPVTKSDHPIAVEGSNKLKAENDDEDQDWWDADITYEDSYAVVYSPPNLRLRCFYLICGVCLFAALLAVCVFIAAVILGAIIDLTVFKAIKMLPIPIEEHDFRFANMRSVLFGLRILLSIVAYYERPPTPNNNGPGGIAAIVAPLRAPPAELLAVWSYLGSAFVLFTSNAAIFMILHVFFIPQLEQYFFGLRFWLLATKDAPAQINPTWIGLALQVAALPGTFFPFVFSFRMIPNVINQQENVFKYRPFYIQNECLIYLVLLMALEGFARYKRVEIPETTFIYTRVFVTVAIVAVRSYAMLQVLLTKITEQIKKEKYVRGTAVENIPGEDEH